MRSPLAPAAFGLLALSVASAVAQDAPAVPEQKQHIVVFRPDMPPADRRKLVEQSGAKIVREIPFIDGILIETPAITPHQAQLLRAHPYVEALEDNAYRRWIEVFAPGFDAPAVDGPAARASELVRRAAQIRPPSEDFLARPPQDAPPPPEAPKDELTWGIARVKAPAAWSRTQGEGARVGVIDTGIDMKHPDLAANYKGGFNFVDPAADPFDDQGHGTHVAGTIAGAKNGIGVAGVAPKASLYGIKVLDADGGGTPTTIVDGIEWAAQNRLDIINMSLGGPSSAALRRAVKAAVAAGVTVVAAAGNDPEAPVSAPGKYPEAICVSAATKEDGLAFFSTTGPEVDFIAPGHEVWSDAPGRRLAMHSGTSMAAPHVAGLAALAVSLGAKGPAAVRAMLEKAATPLQGLTAEQQGAGTIEADRWLSR
ncbi:MAG: S8 family peptidase [Elusimicrobia bacterium]|nr:S8 family peptidase [Elusimicrobiota bacterium]